jgi:hypothetical protein
MFQVGTREVELGRAVCEEQETGWKGGKADIMMPRRVMDGTFTIFFEFVSPPALDELFAEQLLKTLPRKSDKIQISISKLSKRLWTIRLCRHRLKIET